MTAMGTITATATIMAVLSSDPELPLAPSSTPISIQSVSGANDDGEMREAAYLDRRSGSG